MSIAIDKNPAQFIENLDDEAKFELLEQLAEELGYELNEQPDPVDPHTDILEVVDGAILNLQSSRDTLKAQFAETAELEYETLEQVSDTIESVISELLDAHNNVIAFIDSVFDVDEEDGDEEEDGDDE